MTIPGKEILRTHDKFGPIQVYDDGNKRFLAFGNNDQQSCQLKTEPSQLQHEYTRAMLLPLLFNPAPQSALMLGLGGGSLACCLHQHIDDIQITAVELRRAVIDIAYSHFNLPRCPDVIVLEKDARDFLYDLEYRNAVDDDPVYYDLIFSDIYGPDGADEQQFQENYLDQCRQALSPNGWLALNCWKEHRGHTSILPIVKEYFDDVHVCSTQSGNWIILASAQVHTVPEKQLRERARGLTQKLGFSLLASLAKLQMAA